MNKLKRMYSLVLITLVITLASSSVNAHSGRTDGSGGHTDHSTGEYHYHHGYSAHDHYDMDGDGDRDCPYSFDDKTEHSSGNGVTDNSDPVVETPSETNTNEDRITFGDVLKAMLAALLPAVGCGFMASYLLSYLFGLLFGEDRGCSISALSFVVISVIAYVLIILKNLGLI